MDALRQVHSVVRSTGVTDFNHCQNIAATGRSFLNFRRNLCAIDIYGVAASTFVAGASLLNPFDEIPNQGKTELIPRVVRGPGDHT